MNENELMRMDFVSVSAYTLGKHIREYYTPVNPTFIIIAKLIFASKHRLWVLVVLTCTHNLCFEQKLEKSQKYN